MARIELTNRETLAVSTEIDKIEAQSPALKYFFKTKIDHFRNANAIQLRVIGEGMVRIQKQYCVYDETGNPVTELKNNVPHFTFHSDQGREKYLAAFVEFMDRTQKIEF